MQSNTFLMALLSLFVLVLFVVGVAVAIGIAAWSVKKLTDQLQSVKESLDTLTEINRKFLTLLSSQETNPYIQEHKTLIEGLNSACLAIVRAVQELRDSQESFKQKLFSEGSSEGALLIPEDQEAINSLLGKYREQFSSPYESGEQG